MADAEAKRALNKVWAIEGDRFDPADVGLSRNTGWPVRYEQEGAGAEPEREVFNQLFCELDQLLGDKLQHGILEWDSRVNYPGNNEVGYAFVTGSDGRLYVSLAPSGPATGDSTDPTDENNSKWQEY